MKTLTSNQLYRGYNRRFDRRAMILTRMGFVHQILTQDRVSISLFVRNCHYGVIHTIPASTVMYAANRVFIDTIAPFRFEVTK
jgi:hypothetical protein